MVTATHTIQKKSIAEPDETLRFGNGEVDIVNFDEATVARVTLQPGWKWSQDVRPMVRTQSCHVGHVQYVIQGRLEVAMDDGTRMEFRPGDVAVIPPGHDAWVLGDEPFVAIDFGGMKGYTRRL